MALAAAVSDPPRWELYRLLAEPVRLRLLALCSEEELAIGELAELLGEGQPKVSRHVAPLKRAGLVSVRKQGTRALARLAEGVTSDPVIADALREGRALCESDGSLTRVADVVRAREAAAREFFSRPGTEEARGLPSELPAYLTALAPLLAHRQLAVDAGTGDGSLLDVLAPVFERVIGVDREEAQLDRARARLAARGYDNVTLHQGEYDDASLLSLVEESGGADVVFAARVLHHASRPGRALTRAHAPREAGRRGRGHRLPRATTTKPCATSRPTSGSASKDKSFSASRRPRGSKSPRSPESTRHAVATARTGTWIGRCWSRVARKTTETPTNEKRTEYDGTADSDHDGRR